MDDCLLGCSSKASISYMLRVHTLDIVWSYVDDCLLGCSSKAYC